MRGLIGTAAVVIVLSAASHARADDQDQVAYRQLIMKSLDAETAALGMIVSGQIPPDSLALHAHAIANEAKAAQRAFQTKVPGGNAKPEVWTNGDDFAKRMQAFADNTEAMAKVAETGGVPAVTERLIEALPCKECHEVYRLKKK